MNKYKIQYSNKNLKKVKINLINGGNINMKEDYIYNPSNAITDNDVNLNLENAIVELNKNIKLHQQNNLD